MQIDYKGFYKCFDFGHIFCYNKYLRNKNILKVDK